MGAALRDASLVEHHDLVTVANGAQPVGDHDDGDAASPQGVVDALFCEGIKRAGGLVREQDGRIGRQRACDLQSLALPAAEVPAAFGDEGVIAAIASHDLVVALCVAGSGDHLGVLEARVPHGEVLAHGGRKQHHTLIDGRYRAEHHVSGHLGALDAVKEHLARPRGYVAVDELDQAGLARPRGTDDGHALTGLDREAEVIDQRGHTAPIAEGDVAQLDSARQSQPADECRHTRGRALASAAVGAGIEHIVDALQVRSKHLQPVGEEREAPDRSEEDPRQRHEADQRSDSHVARHHPQTPDREDRGRRHQGREQRQRECYMAQQHEALPGNQLAGRQPAPAGKEIILPGSGTKVIHVRQPGCFDARQSSLFAAQLPFVIGAQAAEHVHSGQHAEGRCDHDGAEHHVHGHQHRRDEHAGHQVDGNPRRCHRRVRSDA